MYSDFSNYGGYGLPVQKMGGPGFGVPSYDDIMSGKDMLRFEKVPVKFSDFHAKIYDMTVPEEVEEYSKTILEIMQGVQTKAYVLLKHETKPMKCRNGEDGWKNYIEWAKYEVNDTLIDQVRKADKKEAEKESGSDGVFAKI